MSRIRFIFKYFSKGEIKLWFGSISMIILSFLLFDRNNILILIASLIGVTSLLFNAKGNPFGQFLMIIFSFVYGMISLTFAYYGEMLTYLGMTMPMALFALISWLKNPFNGNKAEVKINYLTQMEWLFMAILAIIVTFGFYFVLQYFNTANLFISTLSITTSFVAVYLTFRRSPFYAIGYAANDIILVVLWILATLEDIAYLSVVVCFLAFLINDIYGFLNWRRMGKRQAKSKQ